jgi:radical SAM superfamily enzyme YgiQ (UPF0313 family)
MKIGLIDVDSHNFPNLALMKISSYHKTKGDTVEWANFNNYDIVYQSKVFANTPDNDICVKSKLIIKGGTGYNLKNKLDPHIEYAYPDYSLYPEYTKDTAFGFLTRGCPRQCSFCLVSKKEGNKSEKVADLNFFWNGQKYIKLLDGNILACPDKLELLDQLIESKAYIDFTQGLDIRFVTNEITVKIMQMKIKTVRFAWDSKDKTIYKKLKKFKRKTKLNRRKLCVYVLVNFNTNFKYDLYRVNKLRKIGCDPFIMIYENHKLEKNCDLRKLARWVNNKTIFMKCKKFKDYKTGKYK